MSGWTAPESGWYDFALARKPRKISEDAWTAPEDGWYEIGSGEPRKLSGEETAAMSRGEKAPRAVAWLLTGQTLVTVQHEV